MAFTESGRLSGFLPQEKATFHAVETLTGEAKTL
jgi:hypothetical protein